MSAYSASWREEAPILAPTSSTMQSRFTVGQKAAMAGRSMSAIRPKMEKLREGFTQKEFREVLPFLRALRSWMHEQA